MSAACSGKGALCPSVKEIASSAGAKANRAAFTCKFVGARFADSIILMERTHLKISFCSPVSLSGLLVFLGAPLVFAVPKAEILSSKNPRFVNSNCEATNSCSLLSFELKASQYKIQVSSKGTSWANYGTKALLSYQTKKVSDLKDYGIVQFVEGCQFTSKFENGEIKNRQNVNRPYRGKIIPYLHPHLTVDGPSEDPIAWGSDEVRRSRHFFYLTREPGPDGSQRTDYFGIRPPQQSRLFVTSRPGGVAAYYPETKTAYNVSLHFKACIYKTDQVPESVEPEDVEFARPLHCLDWTSSYIYNFEKRTFEVKPGMHPFCQSQE